jgi:hypothetical protein
MKIEIVVAPAPQSLASRVAPPPSTTIVAEVPVPARLVFGTLIEFTRAFCSLACEGMAEEEDAEEDDEVGVEVVARPTGRRKVLLILMRKWRFVVH